MATPTPPPPTTPSVSSVTAGAALPQIGTYMPYYPQLPWLSVPDAQFPSRASQKKRRRRGPAPAQEGGLDLPSREQATQATKPEEPKEALKEVDNSSVGLPEGSLASTAVHPSDGELDTPQTSHAPSEVDSAQPAAQPQRTPQASHGRSQTKPAVPLIPIRSAKAPSVTSTTQKSTKSVNEQTDGKAEAEAPAVPATEATGSTEEAPKPSAPKAAPKSWAELLRSKNAAAAAKAAPVTNGAAPVNGTVTSKSNSLGDVLATFSVESDKKLSFLEPRGLVNTGNLCYMNSVSTDIPAPFDETNNP